MTGLVRDLDRVERLAAARRDDFEVLRHLLELNAELDDAQIDAWVAPIADPIAAAIDCRECANCCRSLDVYVDERDARRLAAGLNQPLDAVLCHIDRKAAEPLGEWGRFKRKPCPFLSGRLCSVYAHRPASCRSYPAFTPDFRWTVGMLIDGAHLCPIIYNLLAALCERVDELYAL